MTWDTCVGRRGYLSKLIGVRPIRRLGMTSFAAVLAGSLQIGKLLRHCPRIPRWPAPDFNQ